MSGAITSGVGLVSGLPINDIINSLISIDARPITFLRARIEGVQFERTAYAELSARLLGLKSTVARFDETSFFRTFSANSGNESVLTATTGEDASLGSYQFQVKSLVANHQLISRGFGDTDSQPLGQGTLTFELGNGRLDSATALDSLNGGEGVRRGSIEITDSTGARATIDLSTIITMQDVLDEINARTDIGVLARIDGDHLVLQDQRDGEQTLTARDLGGGHAAEDLGIAAEADSEGALVGSRIRYLVDETRLSFLNDGNGVAIGKLNEDIVIEAAAGTFKVGLRGLLSRNTHLDLLNGGSGVREGTIRITNRAGESAEIEIDESIQSIGDVIDAIANAGIDLTATVGATSGRLILTDASTVGDGETLGNLIIEDVDGRAAADLGIITDTEDATVSGGDVYRISTLGDVLRAINYAVDASDPNGVVYNDDIVARINAGGRGIELVSTSGADFTVSSGDSGSGAADQLGLIGESNGGALVARDVLAGLNSVLLSSLRGGSGIRLGEVKFTDTAGNQTVVDFSGLGLGSVQEMIDAVNSATSAAGVGITARLNDVGTGIDFEDTADGSGAMRLKDVGSAGRTIGDLFDVSSGDVQNADGTLDTGNTQLQYIARTTELEDLNGERGVRIGSFTITATSGQSVTVNITDNQKTIGEIIDVINSAATSIDVQARINANGDGIEIIDSNDGGLPLTIVDSDGSFTARDLNIAGESVDFEEDGEPVQRIDGSFEYRLEIGAADTLDDVRFKINDLGIDVSATIVNDGSGTNPFHLVMNSGITGTRGRMVIDTGETGLSFDTLVEAQDAVVFFGGAGASNPIVLTSSTNTLSNVLEGVTINLTGTSDEPVTLAIVQDIDRIVSDLSTFVSSYNGVLESIEEHTSFNAETDERGALFGESTVSIIQSRLRSVVNARVADAPAGLDRLVLIGVKVGSGGRLTFDEEKFRETYDNNPAAIETLFTTDETGLGDQLDGMLDDLTRSSDGLLANRDELLAKREDLFNDRIETLEDRLLRKRERLQRQFQGLESSLANLQGAQASLGILASLSGNFR